MIDFNQYDEFDSGKKYITGDVFIFYSGKLFAGQIVNKDGNYRVKLINSDQLYNVGLMYNIRRNILGELKGRNICLDERCIEKSTIEDIKEMTNGNVFVIGYDVVKDDVILNKKKYSIKNNFS
jgi:hypothetical protein